MKDFKTLIVFMLSVLVVGGSAKKVCILHEQKIASTTVVTEVITQQTEEISEVAEAIVGVTEIADVVSHISEVPEEIITLADVSLIAAESETDKISEDNNVEIVLEAGTIDAEKSTNDCVLEGITLFADQNVRFLMTSPAYNKLGRLMNLFTNQELLRRLCTITGSAHSALHIITVQNTTIKSDLSLATLCTDGPKGLLTWISWQDFIEKVKPLLNVEELPQLVVRNSSIGGPTESENKSDPFSEVLIEMLPLSYKLFDLKQSAWNNITFIKEILLGSTELVNLNETDAHVEGSIAYSFPVQTNTTFLSSYPINGLPVEMSDVTNNFIVGSSNKHTFNSTYLLERLIPAFKTEIVSLNGTWGLTEYDIEGTIVSFFGVNADGTPIEESHRISARVVTLGASKIKESYRLQDYTTTSTEKIELTTNEELPVAIPIVRGSDVVYPGFRKVFYVAAVIFFGTVLIAMTDIVRKLVKDRKERLRGRRAYQKVTPTI